MKSERDTFDEWYKSEYPLDYGHYVNEQDIGLFTKLYLRCFASWKASASREGYKLVPVVDSDAMWSAGMVIIEENGYCTDASNVYKAMIEAA